MTFYSTAKESLRFLKSNLILLFLIQLPMGLLVFLQRLVDPYLERTPLLALALLLPLFSIGSSLCTALTFWLIQLPQPHRLSSFKNLGQNLSIHYKPLALTSLIVALFFGLGLAAFVIPGLYFISLYFFVPLCVVTEPGQPIAKYLYQSKTIVTQSRKILFTTLFFVIVTFLIEIPISVLVDLLSSSVIEATCFDVILSMFFGSLIDCFIVFYFLSIKAKGNP